jgi:hypothetical protein
VRGAALAAVVLAACGGGGARPIAVHGGDADAGRGPAFGVRSTDPAPLVFTRGVVRYVLRRDASPTTEALHDVVLDRDLAYAAGDAGTVVRRAADSGWQGEATGTSASLRALAVATWEAAAYAHRRHDPRSVPIYAVGDGGTIVRRAADGTWAAQASPTDADLLDVAASAVELIAVGAGGAIVHGKDGVFTLIPGYTTATLRSIAIEAWGIVIVGDGGVILDCRVRDRLACVPRPSPTTTDLVWIGERTVRRDGGATFHEPAAYGAAGERFTRAEVRPVALAAAPAAPFVVRDHAASHWMWSDGAPDNVAVGDGGAIALVDPYRDHDAAFDVQRLPEGADLTAIAFEALDGFVVGAGGTILQLTIEGTTLPVLSW